MVEAKLEKAFAVLFTFFGFYFLYYGKIRFKEMISSIFFAIAVFSSFNAIVPVSLCMMFYPIKLGVLKWQNKRCALSKGGLFKIFYLILPLAAIYIILLLIWPNFMNYAFFSHSINPVLSYGEALLILIPWGFINVNIILAYLILIVSLYVFYKTKNVMPLIGSFGLFGILIPHHKTIGLLLIDRMTAPLVPFIILTIVLLKHLARDNNYTKVGFSIFMALMLIFPSFGPNHFGNIIYDKLDFSLENFKKEVGYGVNLLPEQKNGIFVQYPSLLTDYDYEIKYPEKIVVEHDAYGKKNTIYDSWNSPRLSELLNTDEGQWKETIEDIDYELELNNEEDEKKRRDNLINARDTIANSKFDFLIAGSKYGPPKTSFIWIGLALLSRSSDPKIANIPDSYSLIFIPNIEQPALQYSHSTGVAIKKEEGIQLKNRLKEYYTLIFDDVCKHSEFVANGLIKAAFFKTNNIEITKTCNKGIGKFIDNYNNYVLFPEHISLIFFMMFIIMVVYTPFLLKRHNLEKNKEKIIYFGCMMIFLIISIIFLIKTLNLSIPYIEIAEQVKAVFPY